MQKPVVTWRAYMGGRPTGRTARFGLGTAPVVVASVGGRFVAKHAGTQATLWKSPLLGVGWVEAFADLDGDKKSEVVARTEDRVHVLDGATGAALWSSSPEDFRTPAAVRVLDLDADGVSDLYIDECTGCAKVGALSVGAYSFDGGISSPKTLWTRAAGALPQPLSSGTDALVDLDGDGILEVMLPSWDEVLVVRSDNGATVATLKLPPTDAHPFPHADALAAEIDGQPGKELVIVQRNGQVSSKSGPPSVSVFKLDPKTGAASLLFRRATSGYDAEIVGLADVVKDLDGDGRDEIIFSHRTPGAPWMTEIRGGAKGDLVAVLDDARFEGAADLDGKPGAEVVVAGAAGLSVHKLGAGVLSAVAGPLPGVRAFALPDPALWSRSHLDRRLAVLPRPGRPSALLVGHPATAIPYADLPNPGSYVDIQSIALNASGMKVLGTYSPILGEISDIVIADAATRPYPQVAVGTTAGTVDVLDQAMKGTNGIVFWNGKATGTLLRGAQQPSTGARGGPLIGEDAAGPFVVLPGSPFGLYVGDARFASLIVPPLPRWIEADMEAPSVIDLGPLGPAVVGVEGHRLVARESSGGAEIGGAELGAGVAQATPLPLRVAGDPTPRVGLDWQKAGVQIVQSAVDFTSGTVVWQGEPLPFGGFFGSAVADLDGDGTDEWYSMNGPLNRRDADTGALLTVPGKEMWYALPMAASFSAAGTPGLLLQAGAAAPRLLDAALSQVWQAPAPEPVNGMAGARAVCGDGPRFVTPSVLSPVLRAFKGSTGALVDGVTLAGGNVYASVAAALAAGKRPGILSNATSVASLAGGGPAVLVGSSDGYLYALDACSLDLVWSKDLGASVAEPIVGDTDGDGEDEIVVGAADGFVYAIDVPACASPTWIEMVGAPGGEAPMKVAPGDAVDISFEPVPGATGYEFALVGPDEQPLWDPPYKAANGAGAKIDLTGVLADRPYRVAVRAKNDKGASPDVFSQPIVVVDTTAPEMDAGAKAAGEEIAISLSATDNLALDHYRIWMEGTDGSERLVAADGLLGGAEAKADALAAPPASLWGKVVFVTVEVLDSAGNATKAHYRADVGADGTLGRVSEVLEIPTSASEEDTGWHLETVCMCRAVGGSASRGGGWALALGAALELARRARRRSRPR
ncbi:FG-GAP repeat domain-containing protein [Polyangium aurulentum]|uniref:FG-GAP repeat domain-containing protein n=1 Tax=Polyangium aurulentum TaxID=2567896 RepID=UPI0010ADAB11|nr:VCBS repeat-containing protein [Polyangium aurulentum]UQA59395.1 hypothetical protein E8A73_002475 [Polyangium aurulentum]